MFDSWILALVASVLDQCVGLAKRAENPGAEFAVDLSIHGAGKFVVVLQNSRIAMDTPDWYMQPPRYPFFPDVGPARVVNDVCTDVFNSLGQYYRAELVKIE